MAGPGLLESIGLGCCKVVAIPCESNYRHVAQANLSAQSHS